MDTYLSQNIDSQVRIELDSLSTTFSTLTLESICEAVENYIHNRLREFLFEEVRLIAEANHYLFRKISSKRFAFNNIVYELKIVEYASNDNTVQISLRTVNPAKSHYVKRPLMIALDSLGRVTKIQLTTDATFTLHKGALAEVAKITLESGYLWLSEFIRKTLNSIQNAAANNLYSLLRRLFNEKTVENIYLWKVEDRKGVYVIDDLVQRAALNRAAQRDELNALSPVEAISNFSTTEIDIDLVISKQALAEDQVLEGDFVNQKYADTELDLAEIVIYRSKRFVTHPLVREGKILLLAAYPVELRERVELTLQRERQNFKRILELESLAIQRTTEAISQQGALASFDPDKLPDTWLVRIAETIELKPNIFGLGVNLNSLLLSCLKRYYSRRIRTDNHDSETPSE
jgi:hypothetical protein